MSKSTTAFWILTLISAMGVSAAEQSTWEQGKYTLKTYCHEGFKFVVHHLPMGNGGSAVSQIISESGGGVSCGNSSETKVPENGIHSVFVVQRKSAVHWIDSAKVGSYEEASRIRDLLSEDSKRKSSGHEFRILRITTEVVQ